MSLSSKYQSCACKDKTACGCSSSSNTTKTFGTDCCGNPVQPAPTPCCEAHITSCVAGNCLSPAHNVVASVDPFWIAFSNLCTNIPVDSNNIYFFHPATGLLQIIGFNGTSYQVQLTDTTKAGGFIEEGDCVLVAVIPPSVFENPVARCLCGKFVAPALNNTETIYIENGAGIPIGATITFTFEGATGSYTVTSFVSSSGNTYAYEVENTGSGHTPGLIIDGGDVGQCLVPIDIITEIDLCDLSESNIADHLVACVGGSARAYKSIGEDYVPTGDGSGGWDQAKFTNFDCCVTINGCLKFSAAVCPAGTDSVPLVDSNLECFEAAWQEVLDQQATVGGGQTNLPMNIDGFPVVVTAYDSGTKVATFSPADPTATDGGMIFEWEAGQQICTGDCCTSCLTGPKTTNHKNTGISDETEAIYVIDLDDFGYDDSAQQYYLIGFEYGTSPLTAVFATLDDTYNDDPNGGPGKPLITDPLVFRNKFCNDDLKGCDLKLDLEWNYELAFEGLPAGVTVTYEWGHFAQGAATLADGTTPNPFTSASTQAAEVGSVIGPTNADANDIFSGTAIGMGNALDIKTYPYRAGYFRDYLYLEKCNCALSMVWLVLVVEAAAGTGTGTFDLLASIRQRQKVYPANEIAIVNNDPNQESFNN